MLIHLAGQAIANMCEESRSGEQAAGIGGVAVRGEPLAITLGGPQCVFTAVRRSSTEGFLLFLFFFKSHS